MKTPSRPTDSAAAMIPAVPDHSKRLTDLIEAARVRLALLQATFTAENAKVAHLRARIFRSLRALYEQRDEARLYLDSQKRVIEALRQRAFADAARVAEEFRQACDDSRRQYEKIAENLGQRPALSPDEEKELQQLWKKLVRLYHPDLFVNDPEKLQAYTNLTAAINLAKDSCDLNTLREIAKDPAAFIARKGWSALDFGDGSDIAQLNKLYETLLAEIEATSEALIKLRASSDYALCEAVGTSDTILADIMAKQKRALEAEIAAILKDTLEIAEAIKQVHMNERR